MDPISQSAEQGTKSHDGPPNLFNGQLTSTPPIQPSDSKEASQSLPLQYKTNSSIPSTLVPLSLPPFMAESVEAFQPQLPNLPTLVSLVETLPNPTDNIPNVTKMNLQIDSILDFGQQDHSNKSVSNENNLELPKDIESSITNERDPIIDNGMSESSVTKTTEEEIAEKIQAKMMQIPNQFLMDLSPIADSEASNHASNIQESNYTSANNNDSIQNLQVVEETLSTSSFVPKQSEPNRLANPLLLTSDPQEHANIIKYDQKSLNQQPIQDETMTDVKHLSSLSPEVSKSNPKKRLRSSPLKMQDSYADDIASPPPKKSKQSSPPSNKKRDLTSSVHKRMEIRIQELLEWYKESQSKLATHSHLPTISTLSDVCTDIQGFNDQEHLPENQLLPLLSCLEFITRSAQSIPPSTLAQLSSRQINLQIAAKSDCSQALLVGMTSTLITFTILSNQCNKTTLSDEIVSSSLDFLEFVLKHVLYPIMDENSARNPSENNQMESNTLFNDVEVDDDFDEEEVNPKSLLDITTSPQPIINNKKQFIQAMQKEDKKKRTSTSNWQTGPLNELVNQLLRLFYEIFNHLANVLSSIELPDQFIGRILALARPSLFLPGMQQLQSSAAKVLRSVFRSYGEHRHGMFDDMFESMLNIGKWKNLNKTYSFCTKSNQSQPIHIISAIAMQLIQSCTDLPNNSNIANNASDSTKITDNSHNRAISLARFFMRTFLDHAMKRIEEKDDDYYNMLQEFLEDLLTTLFKPEWPASEIFLRELIPSLLKILQDSKASNSIKAVEKQKLFAANLLGSIATKLAKCRAEASSCLISVKPQIWKPMSEEEEENARCPQCSQLYNGKKMVSCDRCCRWFHQECYGLGSSGQVESDAEWFCDACLLSFVREMIDSSKKANHEESPKKKLMQVEQEGLQEPGDLHIAMRLLLINYLNENQEASTNEAKKFNISGWYLEDETTQDLQRLYEQQFRTSQYTPCFWPPTPSLSVYEDLLQSNPYVRLCNTMLSKGTFKSHHKTSHSGWNGLIPTPWGASKLMTIISSKRPTASSIFGYFTKILGQLLGLLQDDHAKLRAVVLKSLTKVLDADPTLLKEKAMFDAVQQRFEDPSPLAREKSLNMVGRLLLVNPDMLPHYLKIIEDRISDPAISVRRRAVKIVRSLSLLAQESTHILALCSSLAKKINIPGDPIKDQVLNLFKQLWFMDKLSKSAILAEARAELVDPDSAEQSTDQDFMDNQAETDQSSNSLVLNNRIDQILMVIKTSMSDSQEKSIPWFSELISQIASAYNSNPKVASNQTQWKHLSDTVNDLVEILCGIDHNDASSSSEEPEQMLKRKFFSACALNVICEASPSLLTPHIEYLRVQLMADSPNSSTHPIEKKMVEMVANMIDLILPTIKNPADGFWRQLLQDLIMLIQNHGMPVIAAAVKCAATAAKISHDDRLIRSLYTTLSLRLSEHIQASSSATSTQTNKKKLPSPSIIRYLFTIGQILKHYPMDPVKPTASNALSVTKATMDSVDSVRACKYGKSIEETYKYVVHFWDDEVRDVKTAALLTLGHIAPGSPGLFVRKQSEAILALALSPSSPEQLKSQGIKTISDFLCEEDARMQKQGQNSAKKLTSAASENESYDDDHDSKQSHQNSNIDTGLSSTIVELYVRRILTLGLDRSVTIRLAALTLIDSILQMGLTHPVTCVPTLIALETDEQLGETAHRTLSSLDISKIQNRVSEGVRLSFTFQNIVYRTPKAIFKRTEGHVSTYHSKLGRFYGLFKEAGRVSRNDFLAATMKMFEIPKHVSNTNTTTKPNTPNHTAAKKLQSAPPFDTMFLTYLTLMISQLPFSTQEEVLYVIYQCNNILSNQSNLAFMNLKTHFAQEEEKSISNGPLSSPTKSLPSEYDMQMAISSYHLLCLKKFLRSCYALTQERCQLFSPSDTKSTPLNISTYHVHIQDYLHERDPKFEGFSIDPDWSKKPDVCKKLFLKFKSELKEEENDKSLYEPRAKGPRKSISNSTNNTPVKSSRQTKESTPIQKPSRRVKNSFLEEGDYSPQ